MKEFEEIIVYAAIDHGKTKCVCMGDTICMLNGRPCGNQCAKTKYLRPRFDGAIGTMKRDRYGK